MLRLFHAVTEPDLLYLWVLLLWDRGWLSGLFFWHQRPLSSLFSPAVFSSDAAVDSELSVRTLEAPTEGWGFLQFWLLFSARFWASG